MNVLITGGTGYVGGRLQQYLKNQGHDVVIARRKAEPANPNETYSWPPVTSLGKVDLVVNLASPDQKFAAADPRAFLLESSRLAWNACQFALSLTPVPTFIHFSTFHVYGYASIGLINEKTPVAPSHPYALGKLISEDIVQYHRTRDALPAVCLRLSNAFGAPASSEISQWHLVFNDLCRQAVQHGKLQLRTLGQIRNFISLSDVVRVVEYIGRNRTVLPPDGVLNVGSDLNLSIGQVAEIVADRAHALFGTAIPIVVPSVPDAPAPAFEFSSARLKAFGFKWKGQVADEVDQTLLVCARGLS